MRKHLYCIFKQRLVCVALCLLPFLLISCTSEIEVVEGAGPPDFTLSSISGGDVALGRFAGKVVFINFWATWCPPCLAEMASMQALYEKYKDDGLEIVAISVDSKDSIDDVKSMVEDRKLTFTVLHDHSLKVARMFEVGGFPESFFLDRSGDFTSILDSQIGHKVVRVVSDRDWMSPHFEKEIRQMLEKE